MSPKPESTNTKNEACRIEEAVHSKDENEILEKSVSPKTQIEKPPAMRKEPVVPKEKSRSFYKRSVRVMPFLNALSREFGCEVKYGKGSEITVFRHGGKKARLGHHAQNGNVHWIKVKQILKHLGILERDWLRVLCS